MLTWETSYVNFRIFLMSAINFKFKITLIVWKLYTKNGQTDAFKTFENWNFHANRITGILQVAVHQIAFRLAPPVQWGVPIQMT